MPGRGSAPKPERSRSQENNARQREMQPVSSDGSRYGPELPEGVLPRGEDWHPMTRAWWDTWRRCAQARELIATDWDFLLDTALLHHDMWAHHNTKQAAELRLRMGKFGSSPEDRMRLKQSVVTPDDEQPVVESSSRSGQTQQRRRDMRIAG